MLQNTNISFPFYRLNSVTISIKVTTTKTEALTTGVTVTTIKIYAIININDHKDVRIFIRYAIFIQIYFMVFLHSFLKWQINFILHFFFFLFHILKQSFRQNQNSKGRPQPKTTIKFESDFDFEQANTKFEEMRLSLAKLKVGEEVKPEQVEYLFLFFLIHFEWSHCDAFPPFSL